jgi:cell division protein FtsQ
MSNWKNILIKVLWSLAGIAMIVLFVFAWRAKTAKKCAGINITITGNNGGFLFMDEKEILKLVNEQGVKVGTPIATINLNKVQQALLATKWVEKATLYVDNLQQLKIDIEQRVPIARVFTVSGNSFYIDKVAQKLPLRQLSVLRLPVFTGFPSDLDKLSKPDSILLNNVLTFSNLIQKDSFFLAQVAQVNIEPSGEFELIPTIGSHRVLIGSIDQIEDKLNRLFTFYKKVLVPAGINAYEVLDLRFDHQLVALKKGLQPIQYVAGAMPIINLDANASDSIPLLDSAALAKLSITAASGTLTPTTSVKADTVNNKTVPQKAASSKGIATKETAPKAAVKKVVATKKNDKTEKPKQKSKENNNSNNKTLNNTKVAPRALLPKKPASNNN